jgi:hypothetical protein
MKHKLLARKFVKWFYGDSDEIDTLGKSMFHLMITTGQCSLSFQEVFDGCNYIPKYICEDNDGVDQYTTDYNTDEVELIDDFKY